VSQCTRSPNFASLSSRSQSLRPAVAKKPYLAFAPGGGRKEAIYCADVSSSVFLPGDRYFLFDVSCKNYRGQLLVDTETGNYQRLPQKTRVYLAMNTTTDRHYRISSAGILPN
jgi:hypothetical protein